MPDTTDRITELIGELAGPYIPPAPCLHWDGARTGFREEYFAHLDTIVNQHSLGAAGLRILYNAMHGTGAGYLDGYLDSHGVAVVSINSSRDVYFGGTLPDPSPQQLESLLALLKEQDCRLLFATDGDGDRFGMLDEHGKYYGANHCLPLLADFMVSYKQQTGPLVRTVATSHLLDGIAQRHKLPLIETAVGFKYVGQELRAGALIGGEESGGISIKGHVPEKDGILSLVLLLELVSTAGDSLDVLLEALQEDIGKREYARVDAEYSPGDKALLMSALAEYGQPALAGCQVVGRNNTDGFKFLLEGGSWVMFRASGTEPVIRTYIEAAAPDKLSVLKTRVAEFTQSLLAG